MRRRLMRFFYELAKRCDPDRKVKRQAEAEYLSKAAQIDGGGADG